MKKEIEELKKEYFEGLTNINKEWFYFTNNRIDQIKKEAQAQREKDFNELMEWGETQRINNNLWAWSPDELNEAWIEEIKKLKEGK